MNTDNIIELRNDLNITQEQMAKKLNRSKQIYSGWKTGDRIIPLKHLNTLSNNYNKSLDYLTSLCSKNNKNFKHIELDKILIGDRLREIRKKNHLSLRQVAKKLGTDHATFGAYKRRETLIKTIFIIEFAKLTNTSIDYLCGKTDNSNIENKRKKVLTIQKKYAKVNT